jgi:hypothetical protein
MFRARGGGEECIRPVATSQARRDLQASERPFAQEIFLFFTPQNTAQKIGILRNSEYFKTYGPCHAT